MSELNHESLLDPYVVIAQERIRGLALGVCSVGTKLDDEYVLGIPKVSVEQIDSCLGHIGLGQLATILSPNFDPFARPDVIELLAEVDEFQMFVEDLVNHKNPGGEIPILGETSWSANLGFIIPYKNSYNNGNDYLAHHRIIVTADSSDALPSISSMLDTQVFGESASIESEIAHNSTPMTTEQCTQFVEFVSQFYDQATERMR
jgi:hypothetical protein